MARTLQMTRIESSVRVRQEVFGDGSIGVVGSQLDKFLQVFRRRFRLTGVEQGDAEQIVRSGVVGFDLQDPFECLRCLVRPTVVIEL